MIRKVMSLATSLILVMGVFAATPAVASATSAGACGDSSTEHYVVGNIQNQVTAIQRVRADLFIPDREKFKMCNPDDNAGTNGPSVLIGIEHWSLTYPQTAWVQAGIVRCENGPSYCTGVPQLITEWHEGTTGVSVVSNLGAATHDTEYTFEIAISPATDSALVYVNGVLKKTWAIGGALDPGNNPDVMWFVEGHDRGDGFGSNVTGDSTNIGTMQYMKANLWYNRGADCNYYPGGGVFIHCMNNGAHGQYFYTVH